MEYQKSILWGKKLPLSGSIGLKAPGIYPSPWHGYGHRRYVYPHVAHGEALAIVYPACAQFTYASAERQYARMARILNPTLLTKSDREAAKTSVTEIEKLLSKIGLYKKLRDVKMPEHEIAALAKQCMVLPDYKSNPRVATEQEMVKLVRASY